MNTGLFSRRKLSFVTCRRSVPSAFITHRLSPPPASDVKAMCLPSGLKRGCTVNAVPVTSAFA